MTLSEKINTIVKQREQELPILQGMEKELINIKAFLNSLKKFRSDHSTDWINLLKEKGGEENIYKWKTLSADIDSLSETIEDCLNSDNPNLNVFSQAIIRAKRDYINLAVIGPWRQGKSRFITQLTGLSSYPSLIPVAPGNIPCTGTTINIICDSYTTKNGDVVENCGVVYMHTVKSMCKLLNDYLVKVGLDKLVFQATSQKDILDFCNKNSQCIHQHHPSEDISAYHLTLITYIENIESYYSLLETDTSTDKQYTQEFYNVLSNSENRDKFGEMVSYRTVTGETCFKALATEKAEIYTKFNTLGEPILKTRIMDTPGIGESKIGVNEALEESLQKTSDIAIAINKVTGSEDDADEVRRFHSILKQQLNDRSADKFLFYLFNIATSLIEAANNAAVQQSEASTCESLISKKFQTVITDLGQGFITSAGKKVKGIVLNNDNIRKIDCVTHKELIGFNENGDLSFGTSDGLSSFVHHIMTLMVDNIHEVDGDFFKKAKEHVEQIKKDWKSLIENLKKLHLPSYDSNDIISSQITALYKGLKEIESLNLDVASIISVHIHDFCEQTCGTEIFKLFKIENITEKFSQIKNADSLYQIISTALKKRLTIHTYNNRDEFKEYNSIKCDLRDGIKQSIKDFVKDQKAEELLKEMKDSIYKTFIEIGGLGFVLSDEEFRQKVYKNWIDKIITVMDEEQVYPKLRDIFVKFKEYELETKKIIEPSIDREINAGYHKDNFGDPDIYTFDSYEDALRSFTHSLYEIERITKERINDESVKSAINDIQTKLSEILISVTGVATLSNLGRHTPQYIELHRLYENHSDEIFKDNSIAKKKGIVTKWKNLIISVSAHDRS